MTTTMERTYGGEDDSDHVPLTARTQADALKLLASPFPSQWQRINLILRIAVGDFDG